jgi:hypothetical protein
MATPWRPQPEVGKGSRIHDHGPETAQQAPNGPVQSETRWSGPRLRDKRDFIYFWPLYTGMSIPENSWRNRMWLDTWI